MGHPGWGALVFGAAEEGAGGAYQGEQLGGALLAEGKYLADLAFGEEAMGEFAERAEVHLVLDLIAEKSAGDGFAELGGAGFGVDAMAVTPIGEGSAELGVAEVVVPEELGNFGLPGDAKGREREGTEAEGDACAWAGCDRADAERWIGGGRARRRRCERGFFDTGFLPGGHQTGQIFGVGEEGEDDLNRVG